jgi:hypothetical protein
MGGPPAHCEVTQNIPDPVLKYCGASRENAWRFHEDALRDMKGLMEAHGKTCAAMGIVDESSATAAER